MIRILRSLRFRPLACLLVVALVPFACRQLLGLCIHCQRFFPVPAYSSSGHGGRSSRTLVRQLESQTQESSFESQKHRWEAAQHYYHHVRPDLVGSFQPVLLSGFSNQPLSSSCSIPLRI